MAPKSLAVKTSTVVRTGGHSPGTYSVLVEIVVEAKTSFNAERYLDSIVEQTAQVTRSLFTDGKILSSQGQLSFIEKEGE